MRAEIVCALIGAVLALAACSSTDQEVVTSAVPTTEVVPPQGPTQIAAVAPASDTQAAPQATVAAEQPPTKAVPSPAKQAPVNVAASAKLQMPLMGSVIEPFGPRADGTHNDGINISCQMGADIHAAEGGVVAYAGNELKGYGNLVLIRHDNGWVTAYAHASELLVKRGDLIKRGQVIAKAGQTGQVDQPQLHFELRQGSNPVDPTAYLAMNG